jgi:hypothetical protein
MNPAESTNRLPALDAAMNKGLKYTFVATWSAKALAR